MAIDPVPEAVAPHPSAVDPMPVAWEPHPVANELMPKAELLPFQPLGVELAAVTEILLPERVCAPVQVLMEIPLALFDVAPYDMAEFCGPNAYKPPVKGDAPVP
jgi:hypothetical protein